MIMSLESLLELARKLMIIIEYRDLHHEHHFALDGYADAERKLIVLDLSLKDYPRHHKCVLAEEIGHIIFPPRPGHIAYHMRGYHKMDHQSRSNIKAIVSQDERKALRWATSILIPDAALRAAAKNSVNSIDDLFEWFDVEKWFMLFRLDFYRQRVGENNVELLNE